MSVRQLLRSMDSLEVSEWQAYERAFGPLGTTYSDDMLAHIHEQLQLLTHVLGAVNTPKGEENPVPAPKDVPRPPDVYQKAQEAAAKKDDPPTEPSMSLTDAIEFMKHRQQQQ